MVNREGVTPKGYKPGEESQKQNRQQLENVHKRFTNGGDSSLPNPPEPPSEDLQRHRCHANMFREPESRVSGYGSEESDQSTRLPEKVDSTAPSRGGQGEIEFKSILANAANSQNSQRDKGKRISFADSEMGPSRTASEAKRNGTTDNNQGSNKRGRASSFRQGRLLDQQPELKQDNMPVSDPKGGDSDEDNEPLSKRRSRLLEDNEPLSKRRLRLRKERRVGQKPLESGTGESLFTPGSLLFKFRLRRDRTFSRQVVLMYCRLRQKVPNPCR